MSMPSLKSMTTYQICESLCCTKRENAFWIPNHAHKEKQYRIAAQTYVLYPEHGAMLLLDDRDCVDETVHEQEDQVQTKKNEKY